MGSKLPDGRGQRTDPDGDRQRGGAETDTLAQLQGGEGSDGRAEGRRQYSHRNGRTDPGRPEL